MVGCRHPGTGVGSSHNDHTPCFLSALAPPPGISLPASPPSPSLLPRHYSLSPPLPPLHLFPASSPLSPGPQLCPLSVCGSAAALSVSFSHEQMLTPALEVAGIKGDVTVPLIPLMLTWRCFLPFLFSRPSWEESPTVVISILLIMFLLKFTCW